MKILLSLFRKNWKVKVAPSCPTFCNPTDCSPCQSLCPWNSPGKNTEVGSHSLLQIIFPTQGSNLGLLHCRQVLHHLSHQGNSSLKHIPKVLLPPCLGLEIWTCEFWGNTAFKWMRLAPYGRRFKEILVLPWCETTTRCRKLCLTILISWPWTSSLQNGEK